jgi:hypothetical protein
MLRVVVRWRPRAISRRRRPTPQTAPSRQPTELWRPDSVAGSTATSPHGRLLRRGRRRLRAACEAAAGVASEAAAGVASEAAVSFRAAAANATCLPPTGSPAGAATRAATQRAAPLAAFAPRRRATRWGCPCPGQMALAAGGTAKAALATSANTGHCTAARARAA